MPKGAGAFASATRGMDAVSVARNAIPPASIASGAKGNPSEAGGDEVTSRMGLNSGAARNPHEQMRSTIFDQDPSVVSTKMARRKGGDDDDLPIKPNRAAAPAAAAVDISDTTTAGGARPPSVSIPPTPGMAASASGRSPAPLTRQSTAASLVERQQEEGRNAEEILENMRVALKARGAVGISGLAKHFRIVDTESGRGKGNGKLDREELTKCLRLCKLPLERNELEDLFTYIDDDSSGYLDYDEFLKALRGPMRVSRRKLVVQVFDAIDSMTRTGGIGQNDGCLTLDDIKDVYSAKDHPEVKAGKKHEAKVLQEMLECFEGGKGGTRDGKVTLEEWIAYYEELSASVDDDDVFVAMVTGAWATLFAGGKGALVQKPVPSQQVDEIEKRLIDAIRARSNGTSETRALEQVFRMFDTNKNGTIDFKEFRAAMERFGLTSGGEHSGCTLAVIMALFDRHDPDGSGSLSYQEFIKGLFPDAPPAAAAAPRSPPKPGQGGGGGDAGTSLQLPSYRGAGGVAEQQQSFARGRGGVMGGAFNSTQAGKPPAGPASSRPGAPVQNSFLQSSGIFR